MWNFQKTKKVNMCHMLNLRTDVGNLHNITRVWSLHTTLWIKGGSNIHPPLKFQCKYWKKKKKKKKKTYTVKNIRRIYGRTVGNQLPGHVPSFLREPVEMISYGRIGKCNVVLLTASCNNVNMSTLFYPLALSHPYKSFTGPRKNYGKCPGSWLPVILT